MGKITESKDVVRDKAATAPALALPVPTQGHGCWTAKAESKTTDSPEMWCWGRALWTPWTAREMDQRVPEQVKPERRWKQNPEAALLRAHHERTMMLGRREGGKKEHAQVQDGHPMGTPQA